MTPPTPPNHTPPTPNPPHVCGSTAVFRDQVKREEKDLKQAEAYQKGQRNVYQEGRDEPLFWT